MPEDFDAFHRAHAAQVHLHAAVGADVAHLAGVETERIGRLGARQMVINGSRCFDLATPAHAATSLRQFPKRGSDLCDHAAVGIQQLSASMPLNCVAITRAMSEPELEQLVSEWTQLYPNQTGGVSNGEEFKRRLDAGELDAQASRLHGQLLDVSLTSVNAPRYSNLAQDENALLGQVAFEEGAEGLKRGAELNVEATLAVLNTAFPGIQDGVDYAKQADKYAEYAGDVYNDPTGAALGVIKDELDERLVEPLGERLDEGFESAFGEDLAGLISDVASDAVGFEAPSEALAAGVDAGFVEFESNVRAALATNEEAGEGEATLTVIRARRGASEGCVAAWRL